MYKVIAGNKDVKSCHLTSDFVNGTEEFEFSTKEPLDVCEYVRAMRKVTSYFLLTLYVCNELFHF